MRKLSLLLAGIILLTISCEKNGSNNIEKIKGTQEEFKTKVKKLSIVEDYSLNTIVHNPNNNFDEIGKLHNYGCDILLEKMEKLNFSQKEFSEKVFFTELYNVADSMNIELKDRSLQEIPVKRMFEKNSFVEEENLNKLEKEGLIDKYEKEYIDSLKNMALQCTSLNELQNKIVKFENKVLNKNTLSKTEKETILYSTSILRYSSAYWASKGLNTAQDKGWGEFIGVCLGDAMGFVVGNGIFPGGGGIIGAVGMSFAANAACAS